MSAAPKSLAASVKARLQNDAARRDSRIPQRQSRRLDGASERRTASPVTGSAALVGNDSVVV